MWFERDKLIIHEDKLIEIILDIQIAKAAVYKYPVQERDSISDLYHSQIYTIYGIDKYELEHDLNVLEKDPTRYKSIIDKVDAKLEAIQIEILDRNIDQYQ